MLARLVLTGGCLLALSPGPAREEPTFAVAEGTTLQRTLETRFDLVLDSVKLTMDGEEIPPEALGEQELRIEHSERLVITDVLEAVAGGRPLRLRRSFDELSGREVSRATAEDGEGLTSTERRYESELEGRTVVFRWDEESREYEVSFDGEAEPAEAGPLARLREDLDLRAFLPPGPVSEGETWAVDVQAFHGVLEPGGDLALVDGEAGGEASHAIDDSLRDNLDGRVQATFAGVREDGGVRLARIALAIEAKTFAEQPLAPEDVPGSGSGSSRSEIEFHLQGELAWDLAHGHAHGLELTGGYRVTQTYDLRGEFEGQPFQQQQAMLSGGEIRFTTRIARR